MLTIIAIAFYKNLCSLGSDLKEALCRLCWHCMPLAASSRWNLTAELVLLFACAVLESGKRLRSRNALATTAVAYGARQEAAVLTKRTLPSEEVLKRLIVIRWFQLDIRAVADASTKQQAKSQQESTPRCSGARV